MVIPSAKVVPKWGVSALHARVQAGAPRSDGVDHRRAGHGPREDAPRAPLRRADLRRPVVQPLRQADAAGRPAGTPERQAGATTLPRMPRRPRPGLRTVESTSGLPCRRSRCPVGRGASGRAIRTRRLLHQEYLGRASRARPPTWSTPCDRTPFTAGVPRRAAGRSIEWCSDLRSCLSTSRSGPRCCPCSVPIPRPSAPDRAQDSPVAAADLDWEGGRCLGAGQSHLVVALTGACRVVREASLRACPTALGLRLSLQRPRFRP